MNYAELVQLALKGRSVTSMAKQWGVPQATLDRYVKSERMPDYGTAMKMAKEAGIAPGEAFETLVTEEQIHKSRQFRLQSGFVQNSPLLIGAMVVLSSCFFYIM
jgi:transcriptional regulator with XRE-family HTH domain